MEYNINTVHKDSGWGGILMITDNADEDIAQFFWPQIAAPLPNSDFLKGSK
jgi:hypothetical protein